MQDLRISNNIPVFEYLSSNLKPVQCASIMATEIEETLTRIANHKGVEGVLVVNSDGIPLRPSKGMDDELTQKYAANMAQLAAKARSAVRDIDPQNDLSFLRIRTKKHEIMVAPDKEFLLIVIQTPRTV